MLDSYVHDHPSAQVPQMRQWLKAYGNRRNRMVSYHAPAFPATIPRYIYDQWIIDAVNTNFVPVFDEFNVTAVFENHVHMFSTYTE